MKKYVARAILAAVALAVVWACATVRMHHTTNMPWGGHDPLLGALILQVVAVVMWVIGVICILSWAIQNCTDD